MELETRASLSFEPQNVTELLNKVMKNRGRVQAKWLASYLFIVWAKYLQIITAFCLHDNDVERAEEEFDNFKRDVKHLQESYKELFAEELQPSTPLTWGLIDKKVPCADEWCYEVIP